tara:strand:+ start:384 stop:578 length:195 start_codon:yes stop_codon:yes gene_type:complete
MSDSVKKYHEMVEDGIIKEDKVIPPPNINKYFLSEDQKKEAYRLLAYYDKDIILYAAKILNGSV